MILKVEFLSSLLQPNFPNISWHLNGNYILTWVYVWIILVILDTSGIEDFWCALKDNQRFMFNFTLA